MKKTLFVLIAIIALSSCSTLSYRSSVVPEDFGSLYDINTWIYYNIDYDNVYDDIDSVAPASVTLETRRGTCFDYCVLFVYLAKENGWTVSLYPVETKTGYHMIIDAGSLGYYDPTNGKYLGYTLPSGWSSTSF